MESQKSKNDFLKDYKAKQVIFQDGERTRRIDFFNIYKLI